MSYYPAKDSPHSSTTHSFASGATCSYVDQQPPPPQLDLANVTADYGRNYFGFRTRHLSCIEENESDSFNSLVSDILLEPSDLLTSGEIDTSQWESENFGYMERLEESYNSGVDHGASPHDFQFYESVDTNSARTFSPYKALTSDQLHNYPDAMIHSCYGSLAPTVRPDTITSYTKSGPSEPIYAVIDKEIQQKNQLKKVMNGAANASTSKATEAEDSVVHMNGFQTIGKEKTSASVREVSNFQETAQRCETFNFASKSLCPSCHMDFNNDKRRKLIDSCGHERCYSCMFVSEQCPFCSHKDHTTLRHAINPSDELIESVNLQSDMVQSVESVRYSSPEASNSSFVTAIEVSPTKNVSPSKEKASQQSSTSSSHTSPRKKNFTAKGLRRTFGGGHRRTSSQGSLEVPTSLSDCSVLESSFHSDSVINTKPSKHTSAHYSPGKSNGVHFSRAAYAGHLSTYVFGKIKSLWNAQSNNAGLNQLADVKDDAKDETDSEKADKMKNVGIFKDLATGNPSGGKASKKLNPNIFTQRLSTNLRSIKDWSARKNQLKSPTPPPDSIEKDDCLIESTCSSLQNALQYLALKPLFFEVPLQEPDPIFIGRQWILRDISNIITATDMPGVLIAGDPGSGKTSLVLQLVDYSCFGRKKGSIQMEGSSGIYCQINVSHDRIRSLASQVVAYHFCQAGNNRTCLVPDFVHSLAAQLCQAPQLSAYREYLLNEAHLQDILSMNECLVNPERVMLEAILEPLTALKKAGKINVKQALLLIDALCEANTYKQDYGPTVSSFLIKMANHFPSWFKVISTIRSQAMEAVKGLPYMRLTLDSWETNENVQKDIYEYISHRIKHNPNVATNLQTSKETNLNQVFLEHLAHNAKGSFLFVKQTLDLIESGYLSVKSIRSLPSSLSQIFLLRVNSQFSSPGTFESLSNILSVCLASLSPLTLSEIYYAIVALNKDDTLEWNDFIQQFKLLDDFLVKRIDNTYMFFHPSFREWLMYRNDGESTKCLVDFRKGHYAIAFRMSRLQAPLDADQTVELAHHILRAQVYRFLQPAQCSLRDIQAYWVASVSSSVSNAMCALRNVYAPDIKVCRLLLMAGASPNTETESLQGTTILCTAAYEGMTSLVGTLLDFGADYRKQNNEGRTPLILSSMRGHIDVVRMLVAAGSSLGQCDQHRLCALAYASKAGKGSVVKYLLTCNWKQQNVNDENISLTEAINQALLLAASNKHLDIMEDLLDDPNSSVDAVDNFTGNTALINAATNGHFETASFLLSRGAQIDKRNKNDQSALIVAVKGGYCNIVELLLERNSRIEQVEAETEKTPLIVASEEGHLNIVKILVESGASLEHKDINGLTALSWTCLQSHYHVTKYLLEKGANIESTDHFKRSALDFASYQAPLRLVYLLLENGAIVKRQDENGVSPLDRAVACRNIPVLQAFLKAGATIGSTTWTLADDSPDILLLLLNNIVKDGNSLLKRNILDEASEKFRFALEKIATIQDSTSNPIVVTQLLYNLLLSLARCKRKMNGTLDAIHLATRAIAIIPLRYEGYYVRAKAYYVIGNHACALKDIDAALEKANNASLYIKDILERTKSEIENKNQRLNAVSQESTDL